MTIDKDIRAIDLTAGDIYAMILEAVQEVSATLTLHTYNKEERYVVGLAGIMKAIGCKKWKACQLHKSGIFKEAISEVGRSMVVDVEKVREIALQKNMLHNISK